MFPVWVMKCRLVVVGEYLRGVGADCTSFDLLEVSGGPKCYDVSNL